MQLLHPSPELAPFGLRAMKMVATAEKPFSTAAQSMIAGAQKILLRSNINLDELGPITPEELANAIHDPMLRQQLIQGMLMVSLADGPPSPAQMNQIDLFAEALSVNGPELHTLRLLADKHMLFFRFHFLRNSHMGRIAKQQIEENGILAPLKGFLMMRGYLEEPELAAQYRALEKLPKDSLGFALIEYFHQNKFGCPGEKGGFPEAAIWHDFGHVLTGYSTDPEGEMQMSAFQAGYMKQKPIFMLLFGAITFSAGINVTPLPQPHDTGLFAKEGLAEKVLRALQRGSQVKVDLSDHWDHWAWVERPVEEARLLLGVGPA